MPAYVNVTDVEKRTMKKFSGGELAQVESLIDQVGVVIDAYNCNAPFANKQAVTLNVMARMISNMDASIPMGATQGSMSGLGYAQSWTISSGGANGEIYLSKTDKKLLGVSSRIGASNPFGELTRRCDYEG